MFFNEFGKSLDCNPSRLSASRNSVSLKASTATLSQLSHKLCSKFRYTSKGLVVNKKRILFSNSSLCVKYSSRIRFAASIASPSLTPSRTMSVGGHQIFRILRFSLIIFFLILITRHSFKTSLQQVVQRFTRTPTTTIQPKSDNVFITAD